MQFLYPGFLWACLLIAVPIIIHLFYFKRFKKVYFTNVKFLKELKEETSNRNRIKNLLILLSRIMGILALIFAFAQPYFAKNTNVKQGKNKVSIFIDNSFSMQSLSEDVPLVEKAKAKAREIVAAYDISDQFQILTHELTGKQQRWLSQEDALSEIEEIAISAEINPLSKSQLRQMQLFGTTSENKIAYILSDFQKGITDLDPLIDSTIETSLLPFQAVKENNVSIDSVWFDAPIPLLNQPNQLILKLSNHGGELASDVRLSLIENGQKKPEGSLEIPPRGSIIDTINLLLTKDGWHDIELVIEDYPIQFDDRYFLSFEVKNEAQILIINENKPDRYLEAAFSGLNNFKPQQKTLNQLQYDEFNKQNLIVLNDLSQISSGLSAELESYIINGGNVLLFPSKNIERESVNQFLSNMAANTFVNWIDEKMEVFKINTDEFIFNNVFEQKQRNLKLPVTNGRYKMTNFSSRAEERLLSFRDGSGFLSKYEKEKGNLYVCTAPINRESSDLVLNAEVFIPMLYKMSLVNAASKPISFTIGENNQLEVPNINNQQEIVYKIVGQEEFIPAQTNLGKSTLIEFDNQLSNSGYYNLELADNLVSRFAFNYNRTESDLDFFNLEELTNQFPNFNIFSQEQLVNLKSSIEEKDKGQFLWKWCLIFALIFLALETFLIRVWKS